MRHAFRWYGDNDPIPIQHIAQIPGVESVVSALYDIPAGRLWPREEVEQLVNEIETIGLKFDIVESLPVHEDIKLGRPNRDDLIEIYTENLLLLGEAGVSVVVYNFMPLFDWFRTDLAKVLDDGSTALAYDETAIEGNSDPWSKGWPAYFPLDEKPEVLRVAYEKLDDTKLRENLIYFLEGIVPAAEKADIKMGLHPDDPPWSIFDIPRIVKDRDDLDYIVSAVDHPANGLCLCIGSLGADPDNDPPALVREFADRIHFVHGRNIKHTGHRQFHECAHPPQYGDVNLVSVLEALHDIGYSGHIRPDHGRMIWDEEGLPGYGLYDRALGSAFLNGVWHGLAAGDRR